MNHLEKLTRQYYEWKGYIVKGNIKVGRPKHGGWAGELDWSNYFSLADMKTWRVQLSGWTRRHIRKCFWLRWHGPKGRRRNLLKLGASHNQVRRCNMHGASWPMAKHPAVNTALNNKRLKQYGFLVPLDFAGI